ncbi:hypothetical protein CYMTET_5515 [Cymbomonas tetramitiformis]|uniref:AAA+ ATPase domain-containing protein n=1 Tax=Cymbomonas tetramitiformis TaxID=36881 RepID=A0AAE0GZC7_9CHLO|nr:hypothetical protein CYMTET_5515 [Cymbomonas tetramitiformis]
MVVAITSVSAPSKQAYSTSAVHTTSSQVTARCNPPAVRIPGALRALSATFKGTPGLAISRLPCNHNEKTFFQTRALKDDMTGEGSSEALESEEPDKLSLGRFVDDGAVTVCDDLATIITILPADIREQLLTHPDRADLLEVILDLGRFPEARFVEGKTEILRKEPITREDLVSAEEAVGEFGADNRAGIANTLHRISCMRNRRGKIVGLTCRVGRAVTGHVDMIRDMMEDTESLLFLGRPGVGKTTVIREIARVLSDDLGKRVVIVDTSNEIGGDGDVPHPAIGGARRMQVVDPSKQHRTMIEAVENHMPQIVIVDEIGTEEEALACRTIAERGVQLIGTAHGQILENLIKNPTLCDLVGGVHTVTLGDEEARLRGTQKSVLERKAPATFPVLIEMRERTHWVNHRVEESVDAVLSGRRPTVQVRTRDAEDHFKIKVEDQMYDLETNVGGGGRSLRDLEADAAFGTSSKQDDPYSWAQKLGAVPDKDALEEYVTSGWSYGGGRKGEDKFSYTGGKRKGNRGRGGPSRASRR